MEQRHLPFLQQAILLILIAFSTHVAAYSYAPTEAEWSAWPIYCKARYVTVNSAPARDQYRDRVPAYVIKRWEMTLGSRTFIHIHHACLGFNLLQQAHMLPAQKKEACNSRLGGNGLHL